MSPRRMPKEALTSNESYARVADLHRALSQWCGLGFFDLKDISSVARRSSSTSTSQQNRGACEAAQILAKILAAKALGARMCACCVFCFCIPIMLCTNSLVKSNKSNPARNQDCSKCCSADCCDVVKSEVSRSGLPQRNLESSVVQADLGQSIMDATHQSTGSKISRRKVCQTDRDDGLLA